MPLHPDVMQMLLDLRHRYIHEFPSDIATFDALIKMIADSEGTINILNRAYELKTLTQFDYDFNIRGGLSGYGSTDSAYVRTGASLAEVKAFSVPHKGRIIIGSDLLNFVKAYESAKDPDLKKFHEANALFIIVHEAGHGIHASLWAAERAATINAGLAYITAEQERINALPPAERATAVINIDHHLQEFVNVALRAEGRATAHVYNAWVDSMRADKKEINDAERLKAFGLYSEHLLDDDGTLIDEIQVDPVTGKILETEDNWTILGNRNKELQKGLSDGHVMKYVGQGLALLGAHKSTAPLEFDSKSLGFTNDNVSIEHAVARMKGEFWTGTLRLKDTSSNKEFMVIGVYKDNRPMSIVLPLSDSTTGFDGSPNRVVITVSNTDGVETYDTTIFEIERKDGKLSITVSDRSGRSVTLTPDEFEKIFKIEASDVLDNARTEEAAENISLAPVAFDTDEQGRTEIRRVERDNYYPEGVHSKFVNGKIVLVDYRGRGVRYIVDNGRLVAYAADDANVTVFTILDENRRAVATEIRIRGNPFGVDFSDAGSIIGQHLGILIAGSSRLGGVVASATLKTLGNNLGDLLDGVVGSQSPSTAARDAFKTFGPELMANAVSAGVGALSSFLTAQLVDALGIDGFAGELANTAGGTVINTILSNILAGDVNPFANLQLAAVPTAVASFLGARLASELVSFETIGGQLGSAIGSSLGVTAGIALAEKLSFLASFAGPVGAFAGAFIGFIIGGAIGSLFGGTPRSGADVQWDSASGEFIVANVYSRKGGSKELARSMATAVSDSLNGILATVGGTLANPAAVQAGNYGMRKSNLVYRPVSTRDKDAITFRISSKQEGAIEALVAHGLYQALSDPDFRIEGGNVYAKRALYGALERSSAAGFELETVLGGLAVARRYQAYLQSSTLVNALISAEPDSVFAAEWSISLIQAAELGLTRRHASDWYGGFTTRLEASGANPANVAIGFDYDVASGQVSRLMIFGDDVSADTVDIAGQTTIEATVAGDDVIDLRGNRLADQRGYTVNGVLRDDLAVSSGASPDFAGTAYSNTSSTTGWTRTTVRASVKADAVVEKDEHFEVELAAEGLTVMGPPARVTITEGTKPVLSVGRSFAHETDGYAVFRISLSKAAAEAVTLSLALEEGRAEAGGVDYANSAGSGFQVSRLSTSGWTDAASLTFAAGVTQYFVRVPITADAAVEGNETFTLVATATEGATALAGDRASGVGTIVDGGGADVEPLAWLDDLVFHEPAVASGALVPMGISRAAPIGVSYTATPRERIALDIDVAATVDAGDGADTVHSSDRGDNVFGGDGNDTLWGGRLDDWLLGGNGNDILNAGSADAETLGGDGNYLDGGAGNDEVYGREGSDWLEGGEGTDQVQGANGDDILSGGVGDGDSLLGGAGGDQYLLRAGDGADVARETGSNVAGAAPTVDGDFVRRRFAALAAGTLARDWIGIDTPGITAGTLDGGEDAVVLGQGIGVGDIQLKRDPANAANLLVIVTSTDVTTGAATPSGTQLTLENWFTDSFRRVEWLKFADGNEIRIGDLTSFVIGGSGDDVLVGTLSNDFVWGGDGRDKLFLLAGDDVGNGGGGDDIVEADSGTDLVLGGAGADRMTGGAGKDAMTGDGGDDDLYGGADADILAGGRGADMLAGGGGDDIFKYNRGDGADVLADELAGSWVTIWQASGTSPGNWMNSYTRLSTGEVKAPDGSLILRNFGTEAAPDWRWDTRVEYDSLSQTLRRFVPSTGAAAVDGAGETDGDMIEFAPGIRIQDIVHQRDGDDVVLYIAEENSESSRASATSDSIRLKDWALAPGSIERLAFYSTGILDLTAHTLVSGTDAADTALSGGSGADWITAGAGDDIAKGNAGDDILAGNSGNDDLQGGDGTDILYGGSGDDVLAGGAGGDGLIGGGGADTASYADSAGVTVRLGRSGANRGDAAGDSYFSIENVTGSGYADRLGGDDGDNVIHGAKGDDLLLGELGNDTYSWNLGDGADIVRDGAITVTHEVVASNGTFNDAIYDRIFQVYPTSGGYLNILRVIDSTNGMLVYSADVTTTQNDHSPHVHEWPDWGWREGFGRTGNGYQIGLEAVDIAAEAGDDTLELSAGIYLADLSFAWSAAETDGSKDLVITVKGVSGATITLENQNLAGTRVETLQLHDGLAIGLANLCLHASGTETDDFVIGTSAANSLSGGSSNDVVFGGDGNDTLFGALGDDVIEGGLGADVIDGGANSAPTDEGAATSWGDTARYAGSAAAVDVDLLRGEAAQSGGDAAGDVLKGIEHVVGSDAGSDTITGDGQANRLAGLGGNDILTGNLGDDVLIGDDGHDYLYGNDGVDTLDGGLGNDRLYGGLGNDFLSGGEGANNLWGEDGDDMLVTGIHSSLLDGGAGNDRIIGGEAKDTLKGREGDDVIHGGGGDDWMLGGHGNDRFVASASSGADTITDTSGTNTLLFADVPRERLWLTQSGSDLRIGVIGSDAVTLVEDFFGNVTSSGSTIYGKMDAIHTTEHALFLNHPDVRAMIAEMTTHSAATTPAEMPAQFLDLVALRWDAGDKAAPRAETLKVEVANHDANLVDLSGWPAGGAALPAGAAVQPTWYTTGAAEETRWASDTMPSGLVTVMHAGQIDNDATGGGSLTNTFAIDGTKAYKFTYYFRKDDLTRDSVYFGLTNGYSYVEDLAGNDIGNPYFDNLHPSQQAILTAGHWYKFVGYVLPEGATSFDPSLGEAPGYYDLTAGGTTPLRSAKTFRWNPERLNDVVYSRFFLYGSTTVASDPYNTFFYQPEVRELGTSSMVTIEAGANVVDHDGNITGYSLDPDAAPEKGTVTLLDAATGRVSYTPHRDAVGADSFSLIVTDADGHQVSVPVEVTITIAGANVAPAAPERYDLSIAENSASGALVGTIDATNPDGSDSSVDYKFIAGSSVYLVGSKYVTATADGRFLLERDTGRILLQLQQGEVLDYEAGPTNFSYDIVISDNNTGVSHASVSSVLDISITDVNEAHTLQAASYEVREYDKALGPYVPVPETHGHAIDLSKSMLSDPEGTNVLWRFKAGQNTGPWSLDPDGTLHTLGSIASASTSNTVYTFQVEAVDSALGIIREATLTLNVVHAADPSTPPTLLDSGSTSMSGSAEGGFYEGGVRTMLAPIVLDLDGDGVELRSVVASPVRFDMDSDGDRDLTGWSAADDGLLVFDRNGNGVADNGSEISFQSLVEGAASDLEGLAFYDSDDNGWIDAADAEFGKLHVWRDVDEDGTTDAGEMVSLASAGISRISLSGTRTGNVPTGGDNVLFATGHFVRSNGTVGALGDVFFAFQGVPADDGTPPAEDPDDGPQRPTFALALASFGARSGRYKLEAAGGRLFVRPARANGVDPRAGEVGPATMLSFRNRTVGLLAPIILDLDGDGVSLRRRKKSAARFDMDGDGRRDDTGWIRKGDGFLVIDHDGDGRITTAAELSLASLKDGAASSFEGLASLDGNGDGKVDSSDSRFGELKVWRDADGDGFTDAGELRSLSELGIRSVSVRAQGAEGSVKLGRNLLVASSTFTREDGTVSTAGEAALAFRAGRGSQPETGPDLLRGLQLPERVRERLAMLGQSLGGELPWLSRESLRAISWDEPFVAPAAAAQAAAAANEAPEPVPLGLAPGDPATALEAARLAAMVQEMGAFGARTGEGAWTRAGPAAERYEYYAP